MDSKELNNGNKSAYSSKYKKHELQCQDQRYFKKGYAYTSPAMCRHLFCHTVARKVLRGGVSGVVNLNGQLSALCSIATRYKRNGTEIHRSKNVRPRQDTW